MLLSNACKNKLQCDALTLIKVVMSILIILMMIIIFLSVVQVTTPPLYMICWF